MISSKLGCLCTIVIMPGCATCTIESELFLTGASMRAVASAVHSYMNDGDFDLIRSTRLLLGPRRAPPATYFLNRVPIELHRSRQVRRRRRNVLVL